MSVKIGASPISWQNDDLPDLTAAYTMERALNEAREIGCTGVKRGRRMPSDTTGLRTCLNTVITGAFTVPGDGCIDFQAVTDQLKAMDYKGWIVVEVEQDPGKARPGEYSKLGHEHIVMVCKIGGPDNRPQPSLLKEPSWPTCI